MMLDWMMVEGYNYEAERRSPTTRGVATPE